MNFTVSTDAVPLRNELPCHIVPVTDSALHPYRVSDEVPVFYLVCTALNAGQILHSKRHHIWGAVGAGIAIYGFLDATSAPFSVTVDGHTHTPFMPNVPVPASNSSNIATNMTGSEPILLFASMSLDNASHTLLLENNPLSTAVTRMSISYSIVFIAGDGDPSV